MRTNILGKVPFLKLFLFPGLFSIASGNDIQILLSIIIWIVCPSFSAVIASFISFKVIWIIFIIVFLHILVFILIHLSIIFRIIR